MIKYITGLIFISFLFSSCKKDNENFTSSSITDYYPLHVGKYITYNLDSTVYYVNFGQRDSVIHYQVQDRVDALITDNLGRPAYRILRFLRQGPLQQWTPSNSFMVVPTENSIEYIENNLRFLKLELPLRQDFSWKGNSFINTITLNPDLRYLDDWDYIYDSVDVSLTINSIVIDSTIKVLQRDDFLGQDPSTPGTLYAERNYGVEKYGRGIGLIYKEFLHWEYQGQESGEPGSYVGYGVKLSITDHN